MASPGNWKGGDIRGGVKLKTGGEVYTGVYPNRGSSSQSCHALSAKSEKK